jgi:hypothetical protein
MAAAKDRRRALVYPCPSAGLRPVMARMRLFRNSHSQAVRIPAELADEHNNLEL